MESINRFKIIYGKYEDVEKRAADIVCEAIAPYVSYVLTTVSASAATDKELKENNLVFIGTSASNLYIQSFIKKGIIQSPPSEEGYTIKIMQSIFNSKNQMVIIAGSDQNGAVYGALDFKAYYIPHAENNHQHYTYFDNIFTEKTMPEYEISSCPSIKMRGLWTWGHVIYNYQKFIENMMRLKMNTLIIWNDFVPLNIKDVIHYAHSCGIKIICGYAWGWDTHLFEINNMDISDASFLEQIEKHIIAEYERNYSHLDIDGIYFQSFTETEKDSVNGVLIADIVVQLVNSVSKKIFDKFGKIELMFGLHATSVSEKLKYITKTDERVSIIWEDCGAFPYAYLPSNVSHFEETLAFTDKITSLRGKKEKFGAVLKGLICLNWNEFEHQQGEFIMGCAAPNYDKLRWQERAKVWKHITSYWLENVSYAQKLIQRIKENTNGNTILTALVEDGAFEYKIPLPMALMSELFWNSNISSEKLLRLVAQRNDVDLQ